LVPSQPGFIEGIWVRPIPSSEQVGFMSFAFDLYSRYTPPPLASAVLAEKSEAAKKAREPNATSTPPPLLAALLSKAHLGEIL
jgi:hypothetical protein